MKKSIVVVTLILAACANKNDNSTKINCQETIDGLTAQRDSMQLLFNDALGRLDSIYGANVNLTNQLKELQSQVQKLTKKSQ